MTAALLADEPTLVLDGQPIVAAATKLGTSSRDVMPYVNAVKAIPLGAQPIVIDGRESGRYDPLDKYPALRTALFAAQDHATRLADAATTLHEWAVLKQRHDFIETIIQSLEAVRGMIENVPDGTPVSTDVLEKIRRCMQHVSVGSMLTSMALQQTSDGVNAFASNVVTDHDTLARGPLEMGALISRIEEQTKSEAMKYILNPMSGGIGQVILKIGSAFIEPARNMQRVISTALASHEAIRGAAGALANAAESARLKQESAYDRFQRADAAGVSATLRKLRLETAATSWKQFLDFFKRSGL
jgi:hypothetical protein